MDTMNAVGSRWGESELGWKEQVFKRPAPLFFDAVGPELADFTAAEKMTGEYATMGLYPRGHLMEFVRPTLPRLVIPAAGVEAPGDGASATVSGVTSGGPASEGTRGRGVRHAGGRDGRRPGDTLATGLRVVRARAERSGGHDRRPGIAVGRRGERDRVVRPRDSGGRSDAAVA